MEGRHSQAGSQNPGRSRTHKGTRTMTCSSTPAKFQATGRSRTQTRFQNQFLVKRPRSRFGTNLWNEIKSSKEWASDLQAWILINYVCHWKAWGGKPGPRTLRHCRTQKRFQDQVWMNSSQSRFGTYRNETKWKVVMNGPPVCKLKFGSIIFTNGRHGMPRKNRPP